MASLTKVMTATVVLDCIDKMDTTYARLTTKIKITPCAAHLVGTSAELLVGDYLTVEELLHGMLLPSGNDAAHALALYFGTILMADGKTDPNLWLSDVKHEIIDERLSKLKN